MEVGKIMTPLDRLVRIDHREKLQQATELMAEHNISSIIVTNTDRVAGIVTTTNIMQVLSSNGCEALEFQIGSLMSTDLVTINRHAPLNAAIERMADIGTHHLLVGDQDEFVGLISSLDIVREKALDSRSFPWIRK